MRDRAKWDAWKAVEGNSSLISGNNLVSLVALCYCGLY